MSRGLPESTLGEVLATSGQAYALWVPNDPNPYISDSLATLLGYSPGSFLINGAAGLLRGVYKPDRLNLLSTLRSATHQGGDYEYDFRMQCADGEYRWFRIRGTAFEYDKAGNPIRLFGCISDIDELKRAQFDAIEAREKSEWLRGISEQLFERTDIGKIDWALATFAARVPCTRAYLRLVNPVTDNLDIVAETSNEGLQSLARLLAENYPPNMLNNLDHLASAKDVLQVSIERDLSGLRQQVCRELGIISAAAIPVFQNGKLLGEFALTSSEDFRWSESDLTLAKEFSHLISLAYERQAIAIGLEESDERFHLAMEASRDGLWDSHIESDRVYVSPSYFRMTGHDLPGGFYPREITGRYVHPDDLLDVRDKMAAFVRSDKANDSIEFRMRHKDGSDVWVLSRMYKAEFSADGSPSRVFGVNTNITEFKEIQEVLRTAQAEADSANRAKSEFLARMSHEIRTPMNAIVGLSHLMLDGELQEEQRNYLEHIDDAAQLLLNVINDILDFSKIEAGKLELDETDFNLDQVISRLANLLIYRAEEQGIGLVIDLAPDVPVHVRGDVTRLQQILVNLMNNAIKFTDEGEVRLEITLHTGQRILFKVIDSGIGIDQEYQQSLFHPFTQADGSVTRRFGGTGLGLAICKHLVELMGGSIQVESTRQEGSQFTVELPLAILDREVSAGAGTLPFRVAMVSGNASVSRAANNMLLRLGHGLHAFTSFQDFVDKLDRERDWLCLVDDETVTESELVNNLNILRDRYPGSTVRCVYLSANHRYQARSQSIEKSVTLCPKPLTPEKINALLMPELKSDAEAIVKQARVRWAHCKVLLVEDNLVNQKVAVGMLKKFGVDVEVVADGQQAIDRLQLRGPDYYRMVFMDMEMPTLDGYAATRKIRSDSRFDHLPIVAMTAHAMKGDMERCLDAGMNDYISKPISATLLYEVLEKCFRAER